jgi:hypothetical protein
MAILGILPSDYIPPVFVEYLVVAGGGGAQDGGGGAGGLVTNAGSPIEVSANTNYYVSIGAGGTNGGGSHPTNGSNSQFDAVDPAIGGGGAGRYGQTGNSGGSGGGSGATTTDGVSLAGGQGTPGQGFSGGSSSNSSIASGGGGASESGYSPIGGVFLFNGDGGDGIQNIVDGSPTHYAGGGGCNFFGLAGIGGGGAGGVAPNYAGQNGQVNTGGGAGGGVYESESFGGRGGSGIVILKYPKEYTLSMDPGLTGTTTQLGSSSKVTRITAGLGFVSFTVV